MRNFFTRLFKAPSQEDMAGSIEDHLQKAREGDVMAQGLLSLVYARMARDSQAEDQKQANYRKSLFWARKAADQGHPEAQSFVGSLLAAGLGTPKNVHQALICFQRAAKQGNIEGQAFLGLLLTGGKGTIANLEHAHAWMTLAANRGHRRSKKFLPNLIRKMTSEQIQNSKILQGTLLREIALG